MQSDKHPHPTLPGWSLTYEQTSANHFQVIMTDTRGNKLDAAAPVLEQAIYAVEKAAINAEKKNAGSWSSFLFEYFSLKLQSLGSSLAKHANFAYGSWNITVGNKMLIYDGRDQVILAKKIDAAPFDYKMIPLSEIDMDKLLALTTFMTAKP